MVKKQEIILQVESLTKYYGENLILDSIDLSVFKGEILMLVGANGAGKSTLLKSMFGMIESKSGQVTIEGNVTPKIPFNMVQSGIAFVPQDHRVFPDMTVEENIKIGAYTIQDRSEVKKRLKRMYELFPATQKKSKLLGSNLSGGERQMVALARSMIMYPKILLLDEPSLGLAPKIVGEVFENIERINKKLNTTIVIVEHNLKTLLNIADRAIILAKGKILKEGKPQELLNSKILEEVFFGAMA